jgi:hypothetical protein
VRADFAKLQNLRLIIQLMTTVVARASRTTLDTEQIQHHRRSCYLVPVSFLCQWLLLNPDALRPPEPSDRKIWQELWKHFAHLATNLYDSKDCTGKLPRDLSHKSNPKSKSESESEREREKSLSWLQTSARNYKIHVVAHCIVFIDCHLCTVDLEQLICNRQTLPLLPEELELRGFAIWDAVLAQRPTLANSAGCVSNIPSFIAKRSWFPQYMRKAVIVDFAMYLTALPEVLGRSHCVALTVGVARHTHLLLVEHQLDAQDLVLFT